MESEPAVLKETPPPDSVFYIFRNESAAVVLRGAGETEMLRGLRQPKHYNVGRTQEGRQMSSLIQRAFFKGKDYSNGNFCKPTIVSSFCLDLLCFLKEKNKK